MAGKRVKTRDILFDKYGMTLTMKQVGEELHISRQIINATLHEAGITAIKVGKSKRYDHRDIAEFIDSGNNRVAPIEKVGARGRVASY